MSGHVDALLGDYAAGTLDAAGVAEVEAHIASCGRCAEELGEIEELLASLALDLPAPAPPAALRERILAAVAHAGRFDAFAARVGELLDCAADKARSLLGLIDQAASWVTGPFGTQLVHLPAGPRLAGANCGFIRLAAGSEFPLHRHLGEERVFVLQGAYADSSGRIVGPGDADDRDEGTQHSFTVLPGTDLVFLAVLTKGIEVEGVGAANL